MNSMSNVVHIVIVHKSNQPSEILGVYEDELDAVSRRIEYGDDPDNTYVSIEIIAHRINCP